MDFFKILSVSLFLASSDPNPRKHLFWWCAGLCRGSEHSCCTDCLGDACFDLCWTGFISWSHICHLVHRTTPLLQKQCNVFICNQSSQHLRICKYLDVLGSSPQKYFRNDIGLLDSSNKNMFVFYIILVSKASLSTTSWSTINYL